MGTRTPDSTTPSRNGGNRSSIRVATPSTEETADEPPPACSGFNPDPSRIAITAHTLTPGRVLEQLVSDPTEGLSKDEAANRLAACGENTLGGDEGISIFRLLIAQIANALTLILVAALALSFGFEDWVEGGVVAGVIILNTVIGFFQEYKAEKTMDSLRELSSPTATVIRNGQPVVVQSKTVVPGDIVQIKVGDVVPADCRLLLISNLEVSEQLLTGESLPVVKTTEILKEADIPLGDRVNMVYSSTVVTQGRGTGIVVATGMFTQIGRIATAMNDKSTNDGEDKPSVWKRVKRTIISWSGVETGTPLQRKLTKLAYVLFCVAILLAIIVFSVARFKINDEVIIYAIATAVGVVPESLVVVLTLTMSLGTRRMAKRNVIVRKLDALENLGGVTDICSDKTGTLTLGKMSVRKVWIAGDDGYELSAETGSNALEPVGEVKKGDHVLDVEKLDQGLVQTIRVASLCNVATIHQNPEGDWISTGDPTEVALQVFATKLGMGRTTLASTRQDDINDGADEDGDNTLAEGTEKKAYTASMATSSDTRYQLLVEFPFSSATKKMSTIYFDHEAPGTAICLTKGAVERILDGSTHYIPRPSSAPSDSAPLTDDVRTALLAKSEEFATQGLRVIGLAQRSFAAQDIPQLTRDTVEVKLTFLGFCGIFDPPRPESLAAVRACKGAGIVVHMLTGDHLSTARAIAESVEIISKDAPASAVMTATQFDKLTDKEIDELPELPLVIARCAPETKVRMIKAGARRKRHMAMTGDGVNDSPALKLAPIGVGMGSGSDVAKDASELVLTDDNFDSIRSAVAEGRRLFLNIQRFTLHLLSTNVALVVLLVAGLGFQDQGKNSVFPLSPIGVLWVNLITGTPPSLGLGMELPPPDLMLKPPHSVQDGVFTWTLIIDTFSYGLCMGITCLLSFVIVIYSGVNEGDLGLLCNRIGGPQCDLVYKARSTVFATLVFEFMLYAFELKSFDRSVFRLEPGVPFYKTLWKNQTLFWSVVGAMLSVLLPIYIPKLNTVVFYQQEIDWEWGIVFAMTCTFVLWAEVWKVLRRPVYRMLLGKEIGKPPTVVVGEKQV